MSLPGNARRRETTRSSRASRRRGRESTLARARKAARSAMDAVISRVLARKPIEADELAAITASVAPRAGLFRTSIEKNGDGNTVEVRRLVGRQRRGKPLLADEDRADLDLAVRQLVGARAAILATHDLPAVTLEERRARREAEKDAIAKLALCGRMLDEMLERKGAFE